MDRREALKRTALLMGTALSSAAVTGVLQGCQSDTAIDWTPVYLTPEQAEELSAMAARIIPTTDTPGAREAHVERFIDRMLAEYYLPEEQQHFMEGLAAMQNSARKAHNQSFSTCTEDQQDQLLQQSAEASRPVLERIRTGVITPPSFFLLLKELTLLGFFTSEPGATEVLNYDPVPGGYTGCALLEEVGGKSWAM